ncbi:uncharacterized protein [Littorina saxatilis]|uniref:uncharacterized protein n=1 Tax=Littorina saxatilis TaxID=31220 RepID=UPI0038B44D79
MWRVSIKVVAVPVAMSCPERLEHGASAVVTCMISTAGVDSASCVANPTTVTFSENLPGRKFTSACATSYTTTDCAASNADANGTCACTGLAGDIKTFTFRFVADKDTHNGAEIKCTVCKSVPPLDIQQNNCKSLTFDEPTEVGSGTTDSDAYSTTDGDADSNSSGNTNGNNRGTNSTSSDGKGSSSSNLGLIIGATAGGVVVVAMAIGISIYCYKKRSSGGHNVQSNIRSDTPPPVLGPASHPADGGLAATRDVTPTEEEAGENDSEASEATDVSETSEEP